MTAAAARRELCYLDGEIAPLAAARLDPRDRGFLFGDALYEVVKILGAVPLHIAAHLHRLTAGLDRIGIETPPGLASACRDLLAAEPVDEGYLYLQVSRGAGPRSHLPPVGQPPTLLIYAAPHRYEPTAGPGLAVVTTRDQRWALCELKTTSLLATVLAKREAAAAEAQEAIFVGAEGDLREGGSSNLFVRRGDRLETCPLDGRILAGVTRALVLEHAKRLGLPVAEHAPLLAERDDWSEVLLTGTFTGVQGVTVMDGAPVAGGRVGDWTRRLADAHSAYEDAEVERLRASAAWT